MNIYKMQKVGAREGIGCGASGAPFHEARLYEPALRSLEKVVVPSLAIFEVQLYEPAAIIFDRA
jgi:hypothetical protein